MNLQKMMKQAQEMQQKMADLQAKVEAQEVDGNAGGGAVTLRMNGKHRLLKISIDASLLKEDEKEVLEDLIVAAHNDACNKIDSNTSEQMSQATSGMQLPPGFKLPF
jgi:DNA-binding YbaB/EbfC family protein